jgi:hypothetical protein
MASLVAPIPLNEMAYRALSSHVTVDKDPNIGTTLESSKRSALLVSALEQNQSLLHPDLRYNHGVSERAFLALATSLPEIKVMQQVDFRWCPGLASAVPLLLAGLRKNTQACFVSAMQIVHLLWSHLHLKKWLNALAAGCRKWNV